MPVFITFSVPLFLKIQAFSEITEEKTMIEPVVYPSTHSMFITQVLISRYAVMLLLISINILIMDKILKVCR